MLHISLPYPLKGKQFTAGTRPIGKRSVFRTSSTEYRTRVSRGELEELQSLARQRSRIPPRRPKLETQLRRRGVWNDMGALKGWLRDDLTRELNEYAKETMQEIEAEREAVPAR